LIVNAVNNNVFLKIVLFYSKIKLNKIKEKIYLTQSADYTLQHILNSNKYRSFWGEIVNVLITFFQKSGLTYFFGMNFLRVRLEHYRLIEQIIYDIVSGHGHLTIVAACINGVSTVPLQLIDT